MKTKVIYKVMSMLLTVVLIITIVSSSGSYAVSTPLKLTKDDVKKLVLEYSPVIKSLEKSQKDLVKDFSKLSDQLSGMRTLYGLLPRYKQLYNQYVLLAAIPGYYSYLDLEVGKKFHTITDAAYDTSLAALKLVNINLEAAIALSTNMKVDDYLEYKTYAPQFALLGITNPNLSNIQEYETFVSPTVIAPMSMQTGVVNLGVAIDSTKAALASGAMTLYDTLILLESYLDLQERSYAMAINDTKTAKKKYDAGLSSLLAYKTAQNKEAIAQLNRDSMARQVDNLMMQFNVMMGLNVTTQLELTSAIEKTKFLDSLDSYIAKALKERNEVKTLSNNRQNSSFQFDKIKEFYSPSNAVYKIAEAELKDKDLEKEQLILQISLEINKAYINVLEKEDAMAIKKASMDDAIRQHKELEKSIELGFVTADVLLGLDLLVTQATNDYYASNRDYIAAYAALQGASSIGPAYKN